MKLPHILWAATLRADVPIQEQLEAYAGQWSGEGYGGMISGIILPAQP